VAIPAAFLGILAQIAIAHLFSLSPDEAPAVGFFFFECFFALIAPVVWFHYLYVAFRCLVSAAALRPNFHGFEENGC
jgi:hypothetical protein